MTFSALDAVVKFIAISGGVVSQAGHQQIGAPIRQLSFDKNASAF